MCSNINNWCISVKVLGVFTVNCSEGTKSNNVKIKLETFLSKNFFCEKLIDLNRPLSAHQNYILLYQIRIMFSVFLQGKWYRLTR
jgi:hypothetical protein